MPSEALLAYIPQDRRTAAGNALSQQRSGAALWADISGFTPLTETLVNQFGPRHGADELGQYLNRVYDALIQPVNAWGGSVIDFSGDAITCWFDADDGARASATAQAMQVAMQSFRSLQPGISIGVKIAVASGPVQRYRVGDPNIQWLDAMAGATINRLATLGNLAKTGDILLDEATATRQGIAEWRSDPQTGVRFAALHPPYIPSAPAPLPATESATLTDEEIRPWLLPAVLARIQNGQGDFLTELRPAVALFLHFDGLDYDDALVGEKLDAVVRAVQHILAEYSGTLLQLTIDDKGSYLYAAFGAPTAHEDDTLRALNAALALRQLPQTIGGIETVSMGLSRGLMRTGGYGATTRRTYGVLGDDVNLAARLMQQAGPGQILVSESIWHDTAYNFDWLKLPALNLKGKTAVIHPAELRGVQQNRPSRQGSATLQMIGRQAELARIEEKLALARFGRGQIVNIVGEAGTGKSRLLAEIIRRADNHTRYSGECQSYGTHSAYLVWQPIWRAFFGLDSAASTAEQLRGVENSLQQINPNFTIRLPLLGAAINIDIPDNGLTTGMDAKARKTLRESLLVDCIRAWAGESPLILILEDLHWADPLSLDLIEAVGRIIESLPVLMVLTRRPQVTEFLPALDQFKHVTNIQLTELNRAETEELIISRMNHFGLGGRIPRKLVERLSLRTQGNPFYIEELLNYLQDRGLDPRDESVWMQGDLPESLHSLILSRIDQLSEHQQITVKAASIIGRLFQAVWLYEYYPSLGATQVTEDLKNLSRLDFVIQDTPEPQLAYLFKHVITQEVAYESLSYSTRASLHEQFARYLEQIAGEDAPSYLDLLAYHYEHSNNLSKKREYLRKAGEAAQKTYANDAAIAYLSKALALTPEDDYVERFEILIAREPAYNIMGKWEASDQDMIALLSIADELEDNERRAHAALRWSIYLYFRRNYPTSIVAAQQAANIAHLTDANEMETRAYYYWGAALYEQGNYLDARTQVEQALTIAQAAKLTRWIANNLILLAKLDLATGNHERAQVQLEHALPLQRQVGNRIGEILVFSEMGLSAYMRNDYDSTEIYWEQALHSWRAIGDKRNEGTTLLNLGILIVEQRGDYKKAWLYIEDALRLAQESGDRKGEMSARLGFSSVHFSQNNYINSQTQVEWAIGVAQEIGMKFFEGACFRQLGIIMNELGEYASALEHQRKGLAIFREIGNPDETHQILMDSGMTFYYLGQYEAAWENSQQALSIAQETKNKLGQNRAFTLQGHVLRELDKLSDAAVAYQQALTLALKLNSNHYAKQAQIGLAWIAFTQGRLSEALAFLDEILEYLATHHLSTFDEVAWIYLTCYRILQATGDLRARPTLWAAYSFLQAIASRIDDESQRTSFLQNVRFNREIITAWEDLSASA